MKFSIFNFPLRQSFSEASQFLIKVTDNKHQIPNKFQGPNFELSKRFESLYLFDLPAGKAGICNLRFGISPQRGFTLIELLAVMIVVMVAGGLIVGILAATFRGTKKTDNIGELRENGNYALLLITRNIEFSQGFEGVSVDGASYALSCVASGNTRYKSIKVKLSDKEEAEFSCDSSASVVAKNGSSLVNSSKVAVTECYFTCSQNSVAESPTIGVYLNLSPRQPGNTPESATSVKLETSVKIRNPNR